MFQSSISQLALASTDTVWPAFARLSRAVNRSSESEGLGHQDSSTDFESKSTS